MTEYDPNNLFTTKELLLRMETTLNTKIDVMRQELVNAQSRMVSKEELDVHLKAINKDTERIESQLRTELRDIRLESQKDMDAFKHDINASLTRLIGLLGLVLAVVQFLLSFL